MESNRDEYYERLSRVRERGEIEAWLLFFLDGVTETAKQGVQTFDQIFSFQKECESRIQGWAKYSASVTAFLCYLFQDPAVNALGVSDAVGVSAPPPPISSSSTLLSKVCGERSLEPSVGNFISSILT